MARSAILTILVATIVLPASAWADCTYPGPPPAPPRGEFATLADMKLAHDAMQNFVNALEAYQTCLEKQIKAAPADTKPELKIAWRAQGNAAIDLAEKVSSVYSDQYKIFKARQPPPKQN
jgi:hypothetical protein